VLNSVDELVANSLQERIKQLRAEAKYAEAIPLAEELLRLRHRTQGKDWWETRDAERLVATLTKVRELSEADQRQLARAEGSSDEAEQLFKEGKFDEAEAVLESQLATQRRLLGDDHPQVASSMVGLATFLRLSRRPERSEGLLREALAIQQKQLGGRHADVATTLNRLGALSDNPKQQEPVSVVSWPCAGSSYRTTIPISRPAV
jgi:tetratricopeptide (TPR) repeat protein